MYVAPILEPLSTTHPAFCVHAHQWRLQYWFGLRRISDGQIIWARHEVSPWLKLPHQIFPSQKAHERYPDSSIVAVYQLFAAQISKVILPGCPPVHVLSGLKKPRIRKILPAENTETKSVKLTKNRASRTKNLRFMRKWVCLKEIILINREKSH